MESKEAMVNKVETIIKDLDTQVERMASYSQTRFKNNMKPGETLPKFGPFEMATPEEDAMRREAARAAYDEIVGVLDRAYRAYQSDLSAPASADDAATVAVTLSRKHVSEAELQALLDRYQSNHQLASAIAERGRELGMFLVSTTPTADFVEGKRRTFSVLTRHDGGMPEPAHFLADNIVCGFMHEDIFGMTWV